jgi:hypothetical protein
MQNERDDETIRRPEHVHRRLVGPARTPSLVHHDPYARKRRRDVLGDAIEADLVQPGEPLRKRHGRTITGIRERGCVERHHGSQVGAAAGVMVTPARAVVPEASAVAR